MSTIINGRTLEKKLLAWTLTGVLAGAMYVAHELITYTANLTESGWKSSSVEKLIEEGKLSDAEELLAAYNHNSLFMEGYGLFLQKKIKTKRTEQQLETLDTKIRELDLSGAAEYYEEFVGQNATIPEYERRIAELEPGKVLERIASLEGSEKIETIDYFLVQYPFHPKEKELRREQFDSYLSLSVAHFSTFADEIKVLDLLKEFKEWSTMYGSAYGVKPDFSAFEKEAELYIAKKSVMRPHNFRKGDLVVTNQALGGLLHNQPGTYYWDQEVDDIPLGTTGIVSNFVNEDKIGIRQFNNKTLGSQYLNFTNRELAHASSIMLPEIQEYATGIVAYYHQGEKK